ncbi:hypothetical protein N8152_00535 [bacterium]|nr:hypothetical protein [bacterium]
MRQSSVSMTTRAGCPSGAAFKQVLTIVCISGGLGPRCAGGLEVFTGGEDLCDPDVPLL